MSPQLSPHVVRHPTAPFSICGGRLEVHQVPLGQDNLGWLLVNPSTGGCAAIDGPNAQPYLDLIAARGWQLKAVLNTHIHGDHIGLNHALGAALNSLRVIGAAKTAAQIPGLTEAVGEGDRIQFEGAELEVWLTEGHLDGHLSYVADGAVFCGDTLFTGGCGYLVDGPPATMHASLSRLAALPDHTKVCCAHEYTQDNLCFAWFMESGNQALAERIRRVWAVRDRGGSAVPSTIAEERATNPFLRVNSPEIQARIKILQHHQRASFDDPRLAGTRRSVGSASAGDPLRQQESKNRGTDLFHMIREFKNRGLHKQPANADLPALPSGLSY